MADIEKSKGVDLSALSYLDKNGNSITVEQYRELIDGMFGFAEFVTQNGVSYQINLDLIFAIKEEHVGLFRDRIVSAFLDSAESRNLEAMAKIEECFGNSVDLSVYPEVASTLLKSVARDISIGFIRRAIQILDTHADKILGLEGDSQYWRALFEEAVKQGYERALDTDRYLYFAVENTEPILDRFADFFNPDVIEDHETKLKKAFFRNMREANIKALLIIRDRFAKDLDIDFSAEDEYEESLKKAVSLCLNGIGNGVVRRTLKDARNLIDLFGEGIDFTPLIISCYLHDIESGWTDSALSFESEFGDLIDFKAYT